LPSVRVCGWHDRLRRRYELSRLRHLQRIRCNFHLQHLLLRREGLGELDPKDQHKLPESSTASNSEHSVKNFLPERLPVQEYYYEVTQVRALGVFGTIVLVLVCQMIPYSAGRMSSTSMYWDFPILRELAFDFLSIPAVS